VPRALTEKEVAYLARLIDRNVRVVQTLISKGDLEGADEFLSNMKFAPLKRPMERKERDLRCRLRMKAFQMAMDLSLIWVAGVMPRQGDEEHQSVGAYVSDISEVVHLQILKTMKEHGEINPVWLSSWLKTRSQDWVNRPPESS
jgi:hypothetical protein